MSEELTSSVSTVLTSSIYGPFDNDDDVEHIASSEGKLVGVRVIECSEFFAGGTYVAEVAGDDPLD